MLDLRSYKFCSLSIIISFVVSIFVFFIHRICTKIKILQKSIEKKIESM